MKPEYFLIAAVVLIAIIAIPVALYAWMTSPTKVLDEIDTLDLDATTKAALKSCCESAPPTTRFVSTTSRRPS